MSEGEAAREPSRPKAKGWIVPSAFVSMAVAFGDDPPVRWGTDWLVPLAVLAVGLVVGALWQRYDARALSSRLVLPVVVLIIYAEPVNLYETRS